MKCAQKEESKVLNIIIFLETSLKQDSDPDQIFKNTVMCDGD